MIKGRAKNHMKTSQCSYYQTISQLGFHQIAYNHWQGEKKDMATVCVHGLTRNKSDFDMIAPALCHFGDVFCPDMAGRGESDWLASDHLYDFPQYITDVSHLFARHKLSNIAWLGTSMGGIIGMLMASLPKNPIKALILNDVGSIIPSESLQEIAAYVGKKREFNNFEEGKAHLKNVHHEFAPMSDESWHNLALNSLVEMHDGRYQLTYDPKIGDKMRAGELSEDIDLTPVWNAISCPVLIIRGEKSKLLPSSIANQMVQSKENAMLVEVESAGHAPSLNGEIEQKAIISWLEKVMNK